MSDSPKKTLDRYIILLAIMILSFIIIVAKLLYLQVFKHEDYKVRANTKSRRFVADFAPRGMIYDSTGSILATNKQSYNLIFSETDKTKITFYSTIDKIYSLLEENSEEPLDKFQLKLDTNNQLYFGFNSNSDETRKSLELRFKKDRGLDEVVRKKILPKIHGDLTSEQQEQIDDILLKITPEETFQYLVRHYKLYNSLNLKKDEIKKISKLSAKEITEILLDNIPIENIRRYMMVSDSFKMQSFSAFKPITIAKNIKEETALIFYQKLNDIPGVDISLNPLREYPYNELASSVIGYVSSINGKNKYKYEERGYDVSTDLIGKSGIESAFENELKGAKGGTIVKVNSSGRTQEKLFTLETYPGNNVHLTINKDIQSAAEQMLRYQLNYLQNNDSYTKNATRGAAVAIEVDTGRVLALVSEPGFNPNDLSQRELPPELYKKYFQPDYEEFGKKIIHQEKLSKSIDELFPKNKDGQREDKYDLYPKPFYNYATMGLIAPGSTFKPLTSVVALEEDIFTPNETIDVTSKVFDKYPEIFGNKPPKDENYIGKVDIKTALSRSSNSYYYESAIRLFNKNSIVYNEVEGLNSIAKYAWKFGLGVDPISNESPSTGIEIEENFGQTYNFHSFKKQISYYSKWDLVKYLENEGRFPNGLKSFPKVDISIQSEDFKKLSSAKERLKAIVDNKIMEAGTENKTNHASFIANSDFSKFINDIKVELQNIYDNSNKYQESIASTNISPEKTFEITAVELYNWLTNSVCNQLFSATQIAYSAIGQGMNSYTPIQLANYIATLANGGTKNKLHIVDKITDTNGSILEEYNTEVLSKTEISQSTLDAIKEGMRRVNHGDGTARNTFENFPILTGGKTGTATFATNQNEFGRTDFGVYISFAPLNDPKVAVAIVIYDGGHGNLGAPVARAIYESYFKEYIKSNFPNYKPIHMDGTPYNFTLD